VGRGIELQRVYVSSLVGWRV